MNKSILRYLITTLICSLLAFLICVIGGIFTFKENFRIYGLLSDGFFIVGALTLAVGLLIFVGNHGVFEMLAYGLMRFFSMFKKNPRDVKYQTFYDYHVARAERNKTPFLFLIIIGGAFVIIGIIFLILWSRVYPWEGTL